MFVIIITVAFTVVSCVVPTMICAEISRDILMKLISAGLVELVFEMPGIIRIYKGTQKDDIRGVPKRRD